MHSTVDRPFKRGPLALLPAALRTPRRPAVAILVGWATAFFPSLALAWATQRLIPAGGGPEFALKGPLALFLLVGFAPFVETLIMAGALSLLLRLVSPTTAVLVSAAGWGIAHSLMAPVWGLTIWWPFLVFSTLFVVWRQRGWWTGVAVAASVHALQNLLPALIVAFR